MDSKSEDDDAEKKLDLEFRKILRMIKIYIPCIMNIKYLTSYRIWLEKLSAAAPSEKQERNRYLFELCRQIQDGILEKPFIELPASGPGPLPPFRRNLSIKKAEEKYFMQDKFFVKSVQPQNITQVVNQTHNSITSEKEMQNDQDVIQYQNYLKEYSKTNQELLKETQVTQHINNIEEVEATITRNVSNFQPPSGISHRKRNRQTVLKEIQQHIQNNSTTAEGTSSVSQTLKFPELPKQTCLQEEMLRENPVFTNSEQYTQKQQRYIPSNNYYLQTHPQTTCYYQQQPQVTAYYKPQPPQPQPVHLKLPEDLISMPQGLLTPQRQNFVNMGLRTDNEDADDENSWYDLSEVSRTTASKMDSGDSARSLLIRDFPESEITASHNRIHKMCENKVTDLMNIITELKQQNVTLHSKAETIIQNLSDEIKSLKDKMHKFKEIKTAIKKSQMVISSQWHNTIDTLNIKLSDTQNESITLKGEVTRLKQKLEEFSIQKQKDSVAIRQRLVDMYTKEIEMLKQNYVRHIVDIENKFNRILIEKESAFNKKLCDLKKLYDKKFSGISKGTT